MNFKHTDVLAKAAELEKSDLGFKHFQGLLDRAIHLNELERRAKGTVNTRPARAKNVIKYQLLVAKRRRYLRRVAHARLMLNEQKLCRTKS
jgi:hypothetical protein